MTTQRPIGFWVKLVDGLLNNHFAATLDEHGITRRQWQLLNVLQLRQATLAELDQAVAPFLGDDEPSAEHLDELVESQWVTLEAETYALTDKGGIAFGRVREAALEIRDTIGKGVTDDDYATVLEVLEQMARNMGWSDQDTTP